MKNNKFKKVVATGLVATTVLTGGGLGVHAAVKAQAESKKNESKGSEYEYTIKSGDTLYDISNRFYGNELYYDEIAEYNNIENPDQIKEGSTIKLPDNIDNHEILDVNTDQTYTISSGDNLISICARYYNDNSYETALRLAAYNNITDANNIKAGQTINIPPYDKLLTVNAYLYDYEIDSSVKR